MPFRGSALLTPPKALKKVLGTFQNDSQSKSAKMKRRLLAEKKEKPKKKSEIEVYSEGAEQTTKSVKVKLPPKRKRRSSELPDGGGNEGSTTELGTKKKRRKTEQQSSKSGTSCAADAPNGAEQRQNQSMDHSVALLIASLARR